MRFRNNLFLRKLLAWGINLVYGLCFVALWGLLAQLLLVTSFKIPSDSMEPSLLAGDYILVDKCSKGARLFDVFAALEKKEVKIHRMPGWRELKRNDVLVFNFPYPGRWDSIAFDVMSYYVKRCIAVPGDTLEIKDCHYRVKGHNGCLGNTAAQDKLQKLLDSEEFVNRGIVVESYPFNKKLGWSIAEFGPLYIPAKGSVVEMDSLNRMLYRNLIEWEQKEKLTFKRDTVLLGDSVISRYCFRENYYFVSGDKMENSKDSRYWGLLPEPFIVGRALRIWKSKDDRSGSIKWERVWKKIE